MVAIVALIAAILFPVLSQAKAAAKRTAALSNINQIGKAEALYASDSNDYLPNEFPEVPQWPGYQLVLFLSPGELPSRYSSYVTSNEIWFSPSDRLQDRGVTSYCFNGQLAYSWPLSSIPRPAEAIYLTDRTDVAQDKPIVDVYDWWQFLGSTPFRESSLPGVTDPVAVATQIDPIRYVGNVANYLFLDSHCKTLTFEQTWGNPTKNLHLATKS